MFNKDKLINIKQAISDCIFNEYTIDDEYSEVSELKNKLSDLKTLRSLLGYSSLIGELSYIYSERFKILSGELINIDLKNLLLAASFVTTSLVGHMITDYLTEDTEEKVYKLEKSINRNDIVE